MTIAITVRVHDGVVLAADSATTLIGTDTASGAVGVINVYNNANKLHNLLKGSPLGAVTWGTGGEPWRATPDVSRGSGRGGGRQI